MSNETNYSNGWGIFIVIIVIIIIIWVIIANNRTQEQHIHAHPIYNKKSNSMSVRVSKLGTSYTVIEQIPDDPDSVSKGPGESRVVGNISNNGQDGLRQIQIIDGVNEFNTTVRVNNSDGRIDNFDIVAFSGYPTKDICVTTCVPAGGVLNCRKLCT